MEQYLKSESGKAQALDLVREKRLVRARDFTAAGLARTYLSRLLEDGLLIRIDRGLYALAEPPVSAAHMLAEVAKRTPKAVIALLSALRFHDLGTQSPHRVWILLGPKDWAPTGGSVPLRVIRSAAPCLASGVERHSIEGQEVPITSPGKTVVDCFKHRSKVGLDVALEALREALARRLTTPDELWRLAAVCRVSTVMRPYLESAS